MRRVVAIVCSAVLLGLVLAPSVGAASRQPVAIDSTMTILLPDSANAGTFATLAGSDSICASGTVLDTRYVWGASRGRGGDPNGFQLMVDKTFSCPNGDIFFRLQIHGVTAVETFTWVILGGTDAYAGVTGQGSGYSESLPDGTVLNHYTGYIGH